uniref:TolC family protein n=1 Tax=Enterocloster clostridioformis TaxID=1531 RepID=UPI0025A5D245|nr:TolC family protein [Enterocloster clostridioformis]
MAVGVVNDNPEIKELPEPDLARIESMNPEHDLAQAIENNYTLKINKRKLENATSQITRESLETKIKNNEKQIGASLSGAYKNVLSARLTYEQAQAAARLEESNLNLAAVQYQAGMITRPQYLEQELKARNSHWPNAPRPWTCSRPWRHMTGRSAGWPRRNRRFEMNMKPLRRGCAAFLALMYSAVAAFPAAAAAGGPGGTEQEELYLGEEANARLKDNVLEYGELQDMIRISNPTVLETADSYNRKMQDYEDAWATMKLYQGRADSDKEEAQDSGNMEDYAYYASQEATYRSAASSYNKMIDSMQTQSGTSSQRQVERQMTIAAQSLMISYETLRQQEDMLMKMYELYETQYNLALVKEQTGMATATEVLDLQNQVLSCQASMAEVRENMDSIYDKLCLMLGRDTDGSFTIAPIPAPDLARIGDMNLETDTVKAIGNNYTLINSRHSMKVDSTSSSIQKLRTMEDGEQKLTVEMKRLYEDVLHKKESLERTQTGYEKASLGRQQADVKYAAGLIGRDEYLMEELQFIQKEGDYKAAQLAQQQAMDTYDWGVLGFADVA